MEVCLIRHTTPDVAKGICYGQTDLELVSSYPEEMANIRLQLHSDFDQVYSSPLKRCAKLAQDLFGNHDILYDARLKELNFGEWEMMPWSEMDQEAQGKWMNNFVEEAPPNGESMLQLKERIQEFLLEVKSTQHRRIGIVTHSGVIRVISAMIDDRPLEKCFDYQLPYGVVKNVNVNG